MGVVVKLKRNKVDLIQDRVESLLLYRVQRAIAIAGKDLTDDELVDLITSELESILVPVARVA